MDKEKEIIEEFKNRMLEKLEMRHDRYAAMGWQSLDFKRIVMLLEEELNELKEKHLSFPFVYGDTTSTGSPQDTKYSMADNTIDIANYAVFLWYLLRGLDK